MRKSKRNQSSTTFNKRNLTLAIDLIEKDNPLNKQHKNDFRGGKGASDN